MHEPAWIADAFRFTGAEAVMLARGALGNPWLFARMLGTRDDEPTRDEVARRAALGDGPGGRALGPDRAGRYLRKFYPWYVERLGEGKALQEALQRTDTVDGRPCDARRRCFNRPEGRCYATGLSAPEWDRAHGQRRHPHPRRPREAQDRARGADHHQAPRGRRADQGRPRVRRHLRELGVRRREERAGDARVAHRVDRGEAALGDGRRRQRADERGRRRSARRSRSRTASPARA